MDPNPILVLRNNNDKEKLRIPMTEIFDLLGDKKGKQENFFKSKTVIIRFLILTILPFSILNAQIQKNIRAKRI